ncbi:MAG: class I SAM-dependent methyltransferase [Alphaproteobacteria bacterium]|nr:class I SAM-dependent methyltransferase [Alphaproteobacteria bacterium]
MADHDVEAHYSRGDLYQAIIDGLAAAGKDVAHLQPDDLVPLEHFHGRGVKATAELAASLSPSRDDEILDIGSGIGGPARYFARTYGCRVVGIDLTAEFCDVARRLNQAVGLSDNIQIEQGSATALPFDDGRFDGAYTQNVSMNVADKAAFFGEAHRVLRPGATFALSELSQGEGGPAIYPAPWSDDGRYSFLLTEQQTVAGLEAAGFKIVSVKDNGPAMRQFFQAQRVAVARDGAPKLGPFILMGANAREKGRNAARNQEEGRTRAIEIICSRG